jgi:hypothetical protein
MSLHRHNLEESPVALICLGTYFFLVAPLAQQLAAAPGDSAPQLLSTTGGKGHAGWSSLAELKKAADARNPQACAQYGDALLRGDGVPPDTARALMYLRQAADLGEPNAFFRLGKIHDDGEFAPQDYAKALDYYTKAAKAGVAEAQYNLGVMYASAHGVKRDYVEGLAWLIVAASNGAPGDGASQVRERLNQTNRQQQIAAAEERAAEILKNPAAVTPRGTPSTTIAAPQKRPAPAKVDLGDAAPPAKVRITPPAPLLPPAGTNLGIPRVPVPASPPPEKDGATSPEQK